jgi:hypothetical protein
VFPVTFLDKLVCVRNEVFYIYRLPGGPLIGNREDSLLGLVEFREGLPRGVIGVV